MSTIAAISTATGTGGIGIIRMSGDNCFEILNKIFIPKKKENIDDIKGYQIKYGIIVNSETKEIIDEVLVSYFKAPKSYTTENMCEINSHGGSVILRLVLEECLKAGASLAEPGEFTKRAFLNGRIDLSQAESIIDLINAKTKREANASAKQLEGNLSKKIDSIKKYLLDIMADIEASIDYPEYDIEELTNKEILEKIEIVKGELEKLENSFETGKIIKEGIKTVIIGKPNSGKSSLLNAILNEERAIVSDIEGTTRDSIEEMVTIEGIPLKLIDTAGIRKTDNKIEQIGVDRALKLLEAAELTIMIIDGTKDLQEEDKEILEKIKDKKAIILLNKMDKGDVSLEKDENIIKSNKPVIKMSLRNRTGLKEMYKKIIEMFQLGEIESDSEVLITNIRHKEKIHNAFLSCNKVEDIIRENMPVDIISVEVKEILENLGEITGDNVSDDIIKGIFSKFCLGK